MLHAKNSFPNALLLPASLALAAVAVGLATTPYMGAATFAYFLMVAGLYFRRREKKMHRALMGAAMAIDLCLVLLLEFQRDAIGTVVSLNMGSLQLAHVACSTAALLLYVLMIYLGQKIYKAPDLSTRKKHKWLGVATFVLRSLGFLLMFSLLAGKTG